MTDQKTSNLTEASAKATDAALDSVSANTKTVTETAKKIVATAADAAPKARKAARKPARTAKRRTVKATKRVAAKRTATKRTATKRVAAKRAVRATITSAAPKRAAQTRTISMTNYDFFKGFDAIPTFAPFQGVFGKTNDNGTQIAERGQKVAQELADLTRANVEAVVQAGRVASEGARAMTQDAVSSSRQGFEKAADAIRTLAEAKSPTEYLQLQGEFARASFDRMVTEGSKMAESMVKLAGESFQPISTRATANAERFNTLVA